MSNIQRHGQRPFLGPKYRTGQAIAWGDEVTYSGFGEAINNIGGLWEVIGFDLAAGKVQIRSVEQRGHVYMAGPAALFLKGQAVAAQELEQRRAYLLGVLA